MLIPAVSVIAAITLLPALLATLGARINSVRLLPKRFVDQRPSRGRPVGPLGRASSCAARWPVAAVGLAIVGVLVYYGVQLNPSEAQAKDFPGTGDAIVGRAALADAGISAGVMKPFVVLVENGADRASRSSRSCTQTPGVAGAVAPPPGLASRAGQPRRGVPGERRRGEGGAQRRSSASAPSSRAPAARSAASRPRTATSSRAVYANFPYVLGFVVLLTFILLARAFRSLVLPLKAVILNLVSLAAAYGIIVFIFQQGHGARGDLGRARDAGDHPLDPADDLRVPVRALDGLRGLHAHPHARGVRRDRRHETAIALGLARTGKLVTSAALVLMFAFFVLSSGPGVDIKQFGIGLAAGIIFDATVIRALLVPALMRLLGRWNWWLPRRAAKVLRVRADRRPSPARRRESARGSRARARAPRPWR